MQDLRAYRLGFVPVIAALVVLAFSLEGVPDPLEPPAATVEFDADAARADALALVRAGELRRPGGADAAAGAAFVAERFESLASGTIIDQTFNASVDGDDAELRNVALVMPGASDRATLILAGRGSRTGSGAATSAAATGVLLELAAKLGVSGRERTLVFASIDGASATDQGIHRLLEGLPDRLVIEAAIAIAQPGTEELAEPHLVTSATAPVRPSLRLVRTAEAALENHGQLDAGASGAFTQLARLAIPAATGSQAVLLADELDALTLSGAGEVPATGPAADVRPAPESLARIGSAALALAGAVEARVEPLETGPGPYLRLGDTVVPGWSIALLALALIVAPALAVGIELGRSGARGGAFGWAAEWALVALAPLVALYALALAGLIPRPDTAFDPGRFQVGATELVALLALLGIAVGAWWVFGLRRTPAAAPRQLAAPAAALAIAAAFVVWLVNPFLALLVAPVAHVAMIYATRSARLFALPATALALLPLALALATVAATLDWGASAPWQLVVLLASGGFGLLSAAGLAVCLGALAAVVVAALPTGRRAPGRA